MTRCALLRMRGRIMHATTTLTDSLLLAEHDAEIQIDHRHDAIFMTVRATWKQKIYRVVSEKCSKSHPEADWIFKPALDK